MLVSVMSVNMYPNPICFIFSSSTALQQNLQIVLFLIEQLLHS